MKPSFEDASVVLDPNTGTKVSVGYSLLNLRFEYRIGWTHLRPVPEAFLNLPVRRMAMELCLLEVRRVEAEMANRTIEISPEDWVGAA